MAAPAPIPARLHLKKTSHLEIQWQDGITSTYPLGYLRSKCPCASCRTERQELKNNPLKLKVISQESAEPLSALGAELIGNYAIRIDWSDHHGTGIYSFEYLREIMP